MPSKFLRTKLATDFTPDKRLDRAIDKALSFLPRANPGYDGKLHLIQEWVVEFGDDNLPNREVGLDENGVPIVAGPTKHNYGFWLDTNMNLHDFKGERLEAEEFETLWNASERWRNDQ